MMARQSRTVGGLWSTLKDTWGEVLLSFGCDHLAPVSRSWHNRSRDANPPVTIAELLRSERGITDDDYRTVIALLEDEGRIMALRAARSQPLYELLVSLLAMP